MSLSHGKTDAISKTLTKGASGDLDTWTFFTSDVPEPRMIPTHHRYGRPPGDPGFENQADGMIWGHPERVCSLGDVGGHIAEHNW